MKDSIRNFVNRLDSSSFTNNTQRVLYKLLSEVGNGNDGWVSLDSFRVPNAAARLRDLRKEEYGSLDILCRGAVSLGVETGSHKTHCYRLVQKNLTVGRLKVVFGEV